MEVSIIGLGSASVSFTEYLSRNVLETYNTEVTALKTVFDKDPYTLEATDYTDILTAIKNLKKLATEGEKDTNGVEEFDSFMTEEMATRLNSIMRTLSIVGIPPDANAPPLTSAEKIETLVVWKSLINFQIDVRGALNSALDIYANAQTYQVPVRNPKTGEIEDLSVVASPTRTLQSMLELEYVGAGNAQMAGKLELLEDGLALSKRILTSLTAMQNIANEIQVSNRRPEFASTAAYKLALAQTDVNSFKIFYKAAASAYFQQIFPSAVPVADSAGRLLAQKQKLYGMLLELEAANPDATRTKTGSLAAGIFNVIKDISAAFTGISTTDPDLTDKLFAAVKKWIIDDEDKPISDLNRKAGAIQDHLTFAIKSAENLEEKQRENVRRFLFLFQEFYKSAASMIELIGQMFDKITRGIKQ